MCMALYFWNLFNISLPSNDSLLSSTLGVSGVLVGFLATSKAILIAMNSKIIDDLRSSGYMVFLVSYIGQAIWLNLSFCTMNVSGFFQDQTQPWYSGIWIALAVGSLLSFMRVADTMLAIFRRH